MDRGVAGFHTDARLGDDLGDFELLSADPNPWQEPSNDRSGSIPCQTVALIYRMPIACLILLISVGGVASVSSTSCLIFSPLVGVMLNFLALAAAT